MDLDTELLRICLERERLKCLLEREFVSDHLVEIQDASLHALYCGGPCIAVAVDELEVNLEVAYVSI